MGDTGNPYARFRRSPETATPTSSSPRPVSFPRVALDDALRICLVLGDGDPDRYERAAVRLLGRFALEAVALRPPSFDLPQTRLTCLPIGHPRRWSDCRLCILSRGVR
jgi:hypothetical protein